MGSFQGLHVSLTLALSLSFLALGSALDMSIIDYDAEVEARTESHLMNTYEAWLVKHGKVYNALGEKERRFEIFKDNLRFIVEHNSAGNNTYKLGLNNFADLTNEEYRAKFLGTRSRHSEGKRLSGPKNSDRYAYRDSDELPDSVDWREKGAVAPVKDQGQCG